MIDLNDLRIFEKVGALRGVDGAAQALQLPASTIIRSVARLEAALGADLLQTDATGKTLTAIGQALITRCGPPLEQLFDAAHSLTPLLQPVEGLLNLSAGVGFGINVLAEQLPGFTRLYPRVTINLELTNQLQTLMADEIDVAIGLGTLTDSSLGATRLGHMRKVLCASPNFLTSHPVPEAPAECADLDVVDLGDFKGSRRTWTFSKGGDSCEVEVSPKISVNDLMTIFRLVLNGAGIGVLACYLCEPELKAGRLIHLLPGWSLSTIDVNMFFPSRREFSPVVRAFVAYLKKTNMPGMHWQQNRLHEEFNSTEV